MRAAKGVMACELDDGLALLHEASGNFYVLGEVESFIWHRLATPATTTEVTGAVKDAYDASPSEVDRDVREFVRSMVEAELFQIEGR